MDALKALIVEKKRSIHNINDASTTTTANSSNSNNNSKNKRKQYLTVSQRRQLQQQQQQQQQQSTDNNNNDDNEESERKHKKRRKNKHNHHNNDSDTDSNDGDDDGQDLTALLTTKKYYDTSLLLRHKREDDKNNNNNRVENDNNRERLEKGGATKQKMGDDGNDSKKQRLSMENDDDGGNVDNTNSSGSIGKNSTKRNDDDDNGVVNIPQELRQLTVDEVTTQLRSYGLPIRLFGEKLSNDNNNNNNNNDNNNVDDSARLIRLHAAIQGREATILGISEKDEFLLDSADRTRNVFLEKDAATMSTSNNVVATSTPVKSKEQQQQQQQEQKQQNNERGQHLLTEEERNDKPKRIYRYFKTLIRQWEEDLNTRSESTKHTLAGKNETKTLKQCTDYIRPLFQLCKRRELDESLQNHLFKIVMNCEEGEFVKAHDAYLDVAIGRAAWPIGVTMVGIHARSGRAKIESANVAHVMNSELQRKYLTSVKRLMSYAQRKRGDVDPSKKVVNL